MQQYISACIFIHQLLVINLSLHLLLHFVKKNKGLAEYFFTS